METDWCGSFAMIFSIQFKVAFGVFGKQRENMEFDITCGRVKKRGVELTIYPIFVYVILSHYLVSFYIVIISFTFN